MSAPARGEARPMPRAAILLAAALLLLCAHGLVRAEEEFERTAIRLEQNVSDKDVEVVLEATSDKAGMRALSVVAPDGRTIVRFRSPDSQLGIRHFTYESPELRNDGRLQKDFPEGEYTITGITVTGDTLRGSATLSHKLPTAPTLVQPRPDAKGLPVDGVQIRWNAMKDLAGVVVVVEHEKTNRKISVTLPGTATAFTVPSGFLAHGTEYKLAIGSMSREGNQSFIETEFTTGAKK